MADSPVYDPDAGAIALQQQEDFARFLSQRDLSLQVPVNFVSYAGVVLTAACFPNNHYDDAAFKKCLSNLLATGFRRVDADVYWDVSRGQWSLCPVELGNAGLVSTSSLSTATTPLQTETQLSANTLTARTPSLSPSGEPATATKVQRQDGGSALPLASTAGATSRTPSSISTTITLDPNTATAFAMPLNPSPSAPSDSIVIEAGAYSCTPEVNFSLLVSTISQHIAATETTVNATTIVLTLNLHAAAPASNPTGSAQQPLEINLPQGSSLLSSILANNASVYLYTPENLESQRSNLNRSQSWFTLDPTTQPLASYFDIDDDHGRLFTNNGWPSESFVELTHAKRLLVGYGETDPQMSSYNFAADSSTIFPREYLESPRTISVATNGTITSGCFFDPANTSLTAANSSWAIAPVVAGLTGSSLDSLWSQVQNLTACGISPVLNSTLNNTSADQNYEPYATFVQSTIWSWAPSQPINASAQSSAFANYHCAALNATSGSWRAADCSASYYGACRVQAAPYRWQITDAAATYDRIDRGCDESSAFDVPRTALENTYLLSTWRAWRREHADDEDDSGPLLWLDFNDVDVSTCWVIGQSTSCPYNGPPSTAVRELVVPTVAGVIIFVLALLTILVKCAGNRQQSKRRRRRGDDGWDYEGVPS